MQTLIEVFEAEVMKSTRCERSDPFDSAWLRVHSKAEVDAAWDAEIARRIGQINSGAVECSPWETVMVELRAKLRDAVDPPSTATRGARR